MVCQFPFNYYDKITAPILDKIQHAILKTDALSSLVAMLKSQSSWMQLFGWRVLSELAKNGMWGPFQL
jgi:hypothetical protein